MRYYGNKTKLLPFIEQVVKSTGVNGSSNFVDLFSGTCSVGKHFKKLGYTVVANDTLEFSYVLSKTFIELNELPKFEKLKNYFNILGENQILFDFLNAFDTNDIKSGFIFQNYSPNGGRQYFSDENALKIDTFRILFHEWKKTELISELEFYYLLTSLLRAVNLVSNVSGTYGAYLKTWDNRALKSLILSPVEIISNSNNNKAFKRDANELINEISTDILYLDPPYNSRQYASNYHILETIAEGWFDKSPEIYGETGMRRYEHQKSDYASKSKALTAFEELIFRATDTKYIILSYSNEGIIPINLIEDSLKRIGKVEIHKEEHKRYKSINQSMEGSQLTLEHLFVVKTNKTLNKTNRLTGKEWLQNSFSIWKELGKTEEERKLGHPAIFTIKLVTKLINTFCKPGKSLVLDCFAGSGTTLIAGLREGNDVIGFDLNLKFQELFIQRACNFYGISPIGLKEKYIINNSKFITQSISPDSVDVCITSPPYWDILNQKRTVDLKENVNYSDDSEDLGNIADYEVFLNELKIVFSEVKTVLKLKSYFIVNVMDLRKKDKFFPLHIDTVKIAQEVGFSLEDIIIWDRQAEYNNMRPLGYPYKFIVNKVHEYLLIFRKLS